MAAYYHVKSISLEYEYSENMKEQSIFCLQKKSYHKQLSAPILSRI